MFETLESRRLLSVTALFSDGGSAVANGPGSHELMIKAGDTANHVIVVENNGSVIISNVVTSELVTFDNITSIKFSGGAADDTLFYQGNSIGASVSGDSGNDNILLWDRGTASSTVDGGAGDDAIEVYFSAHAVVSGGSGNDWLKINSGAGAIVVDPSSSDILVTLGSGADVIFVYGGTIHADGGSGDDTFVDQSGGNAYYGEFVEATGGYTYLTKFETIAVV